MDREPGHGELKHDELIRQNAITKEWYFLNKGDNSIVPTQPSILNFTPFNASYKYELVNPKPSKYQRKNLSLQFNLL